MNSPKLGLHVQPSVPCSAISCNLINRFSAKLKGGSGEQEEAAPAPDVLCTSERLSFSWNHSPRQGLVCAAGSTWMDQDMESERDGLGGIMCDFSYLKVGTFFSLIRV